MLVGFNYNNNEYFYSRDLTGNINKIIDINGIVKVEYKYDAWGKVLSITGDNTLKYVNSFLYKGYYYDFETSIYYCNSRYYDPEVLRWISIDEVSYLDSDSATGINLWCYCNNNPIVGYDPDGYWSWKRFGKTLGIVTIAIALVAVSVAVAVATGGASVAATIAISSTITILSKTATVATLQYKKSKADGDSRKEIFNDMVDSIWNNGLKIIGLTPLTKTSGYAIGIYSQSSIMNDVMELMKIDGFNIKNFFGGSAYAIAERFTNAKEYLSMTTSKLGFAISYGFAAIYAIEWGVAIFSEDYEKIAQVYGYTLS